MSLLKNALRALIKPPSEPEVVALYNACVNQARHPYFYEKGQVPDTLEGRFDLLLLHIILVMHRLHERADMKQGLFDLMFADIDRGLREMGVSDMRMGKRMQQMIAAFYGRSKVYEEALHHAHPALAEALQRNIYATEGELKDHVQKLTLYAKLVLSTLENQPITDIAAGKIEFPTPAF